MVQRKLCTYHTSIAVMLVDAHISTIDSPYLAAPLLHSAVLAVTVLAEGQAYHSLQLYSCNLQPPKADIDREENIEYVGLMQQLFPAFELLGRCESAQRLLDPCDGVRHL